MTSFFKEEQGRIFTEQQLLPFLELRIRFAQFFSAQTRIVVAIVILLFKQTLGALVPDFSHQATLPCRSRITYWLIDNRIGVEGVDHHTLSILVRISQFLSFFLHAECLC